MNNIEINNRILLSAIRLKDAIDDMAKYSTMCGEGSSVDLTDAEIKYAEQNLREVHTKLEESEDAFYKYSEHLFDSDPDMLYSIYSISPEKLFHLQYDDYTEAPYTGKSYDVLLKVIFENDESLRAKANEFMSKI